MKVVKNAGITFKSGVYIYTGNYRISRMDKKNIARYIAREVDRGVRR